MSLKFSCTFLSLALAAAAIIAPSSAAPSDNASPFKVTAEIINQKYCPDNDHAYHVVFTLHIRFVNQTDRKIIVSKDLGKGLFDIKIAADANSFYQGKYEYDVNIDWEFGSTSPETPEQFKTPDSSFAILSPGESIQNDGDFWASNIGPLPGSAPSRGALHPGSHVLVVWPSAWHYRTDPEQIRKKWESFGDLFYKSVLVGPLPFNLPADPKIEKCN
jgi:hypothetical protein